MARGVRDCGSLIYTRHQLFFREARTAKTSQIETLLKLFAMFEYGAETNLKLFVVFEVI